jgi:autotransporter-associated beta strand protein
VVRVVNNQVLANAHSPIFIRNNNAGSSTLQLDGSAGNITLPQAVTLNGRNNAVVAVENVAGTNTISGGITVNVGGANYLIQSDSGLVSLGGTLTSMATGTRTFTFLGAGNHAVTGAIGNGSATVNIAKSGNGVLALSGANTYTGSTAVSGGTLLVNGSLSTGAVTVVNATLGGAGTINGPVTIQSGATLAPGNPLGSLTVGNNLTLLAGSTDVVELNKTALTNDLLNVTGTLTCGGNLVVTNLAGTLAAGDSFKLFNAGSYSGSFAGVSLPPLVAGLAWQTNTLLADGTLRIVATNNPVISSFALSGNNFLLSVTGGPAGSPYRVFASTNLALPLTNWTPVWTDSFGLDGSGFFTNPANSTNALQFFNIRVP